MEESYSSGLRVTFLVHAIAGTVFGLAYLFVPETVGALMNWTMEDPAYRTIGAAILGFTASSWLALRQQERARVKIVVQAQIVWTVLGTLAALMGLFMADLPPSAWLNVVLLAAFAVAFGVFYPRE
jgi:hypothetical protein